MFYIAGTGTRKLVLMPDVMAVVVSQISDILLAAKAARGEITVISGMAEGFDEAMALGAIRAQVPFLAYIPHPTYGDYYWGSHTQSGRDRTEEFNNLLKQAAGIHISAITLYVDGVHVNFLRNKHMVDKCDILWAYSPDWYKGSKGTAHAITYATSVGRRIYFIK